MFFITLDEGCYKMATSSPRGLDSSATKGAPLFMAHGASAVHPRKIFLMVCLQGGSRWCPLSYKLVYKPYLLELQMHQLSDSDLSHQQGREDRAATHWGGRGRFFRRDLKTTIFGQNRGGLHIFIWLVVWNMTFIFPYIGNFIIRTHELHHFSEG